MRSIFYILSDDHLGSTPLPAPGSMVQVNPDPAPQADVNSTAGDDDVMEVTVQPPAVHGTSSVAPKRKQLGELFSGSSKQQRSFSQS
jgi:hypothetical protein